MKNKALITFLSTHDAIAAEKILSEKAKVTLRPTPREISAACGISIEIMASDLFGEDSLLSRIKIFKVYNITNGKYEEIILCNNL